MADPSTGVDAMTRTLDQLLDEHGFDEGHAPIMRSTVRLVAKAWAEQEGAAARSSAANMLAKYREAIAACDREHPEVAALRAWKAEAQRMGDAALAAWTLRVHEAESELSALRKVASSLLKESGLEDHTKVSDEYPNAGHCLNCGDPWPCEWAQLVIAAREALAAAQAVEPQKGE